MTPRRFSPWGALCCGLALTVPAAAAPAPPPTGREAPLTQLPAAAPLVIQLHGLDRTRDHVVAFIENTMPTLAPLVRAKIDDTLKQALMGRELKGIAKGESIFLVFTELPNVGTTVPKMALFVPVTKYETFRDALLSEEERKGLKEGPGGSDSTTLTGSPIYFVNRKNGYAIVTPNPDVAAALAGKSAGLRLSPSFTRGLLESDLSVYADMEAVNKTYAEQIKQLRQSFEQGTEQNPNKAAVEQAKRVYAPFFQALLDSKALLVTVDVPAEGVRLHAEVEVSPGTSTSKWLKAWHHLPLAGLGKLPAGSMSYNGLALSPDLLEPLGPTLFGVVSTPDTPEGKGVDQAVAALTAAGPRHLFTATDLPLGGLQVWEYRDSAKAVEAQRQLFQSLKGDVMYSGAVLQGAPAVKENAEKHGGFAFHAAALKWDLEKTADRMAPPTANADQKKAMVEYVKTLYGEGMNVWFGSDGKTVLQVTAKDWPAARALVDRYVKGEKVVDGQPAFKEIARHLPANAAMWTLIDAPHYTEAFVPAFFKLYEGLGTPVPPALTKPAAVKAETAFVGLALTREADRADLEVWVSAASVNQLYKMYLKALLKTLPQNENR